MVQWSQSYHDPHKTSASDSRELGDARSPVIDREGDQVKQHHNTSQHHIIRNVSNRRMRRKKNYILYSRYKYRKHLLCQFPIPKKKISKKCRKKPPPADVRNCRSTHSSFRLNQQNTSRQSHCCLISKYSILMFFCKIVCTNGYHSPTNYSLTTWERILTMLIHIQGT